MKQPSIGEALEAEIVSSQSMRFLHIVSGGRFAKRKDWPFSACVKYWHAPLVTMQRVNGQRLVSNLSLVCEYCLIL